MGGWVFLCLSSCLCSQQPPAPVGKIPHCPSSQLTLKKYICVLCHLHCFGISTTTTSSLTLTPLNSLFIRSLFVFILSSSLTEFIEYTPLQYYHVPKDIRFPSDGGTFVEEHAPDNARCIFIFPAHSNKCKIAMVKSSLIFYHLYNTSGAHSYWLFVCISK